MKRGWGKEKQIYQERDRKENQSGGHVKDQRKIMHLEIFMKFHEKFHFMKGISSYKIETKIF